VAATLSAGCIYPVEVAIREQVTRQAVTVPRPPFLQGVITVAINKVINVPCKSNSNSLANQLGIHKILAKQEKLDSLANQLVKNGNLVKLTSPRAYMRARIVVAIVVSL
jgi:hypothetical protein